MKKLLVEYFSASDVTKNIATALATASGGDLYEIKPEVLYTPEDLNWHKKDARSTIEMHDKAYRPPLADKNAKVEEYDTILLGFPI